MGNDNQDKVSAEAVTNNDSPKQAASENNKDSAREADTSSRSANPVVTEIRVEKYDVSQFPRIAFIDDFPLSSEVLFGLRQAGYRQITQLQQGLLLSFLSTGDGWFVSRLGSNRLSMMSAYFSQVALEQKQLINAGINKEAASNTGPWVLVCSIIPEVQRNLGQELCNVGSLLGTTLLEPSAEESLPHDGLSCLVLPRPSKRRDAKQESVAAKQLVSKPHFVIGGPEELLAFAEHNDVSSTRIIYFDEFDNTLSSRLSADESRRREHTLQQLWSKLPSDVQLLVQSAGIDGNQVRVIGKMGRELLARDVVRAQGNNKRQLEWVSEPFSTSLLNRILLDTDPSRALVIASSPAEAARINTALFEQGWELVQLEKDTSRRRREQILFSIQHLRNRVLVVTDTLLSSLHNTDFDCVIWTQVPTEAHFRTSWKRATGRIFCLDILEPAFNGIQVVQAVVENEQQLNHQSLQRQLRELRQQQGLVALDSYAQTVRYMLAQPDGHQLLAAALQLAGERQRSLRKLLDEECQYLERRDVFKAQKKSGRGRGRGPRR